MGVSRILEWVGAGVAALLVVLLTWMFDIQQMARHNAEERARVLDRLSSQRASMEAGLNARLHLVRGLAAFVRADRQITEERFNAFARELLHNRRDVRALDLAPGGVIRYVYPYEANKAALGVNIFAIPRFQDVLKRTIEKNILTVAGPVDLVQGGAGLIGRIPIFVEAAGQRELWGLAIIVLDLPPLLMEAGLLTDDLITHSLRGRDGLGAEGEVFFGNADVFQQNPVILDVSIPSGTWQIAAIPHQGWATTWPHRWSLWMGGILCALLAAAITHRLLLQNRRLRQAITQSRASETRFRALFDQSFQMIGLLHPSGLLLDANQAAPDLLGCPLDNIQDRLLWDAPHFRRSAAAVQTLRQHVELAGAGGDLQRFDATLIREDGSELIVDLTLKPQCDETGKVETLLLECRDVTDRVRDKEELHKAVDCLAESNMELERFAYVASHDLQEPLRSITGFAQLLERRCRTKLAPDEMEFLDFIVSGAKRMHNLVNDLLTYSRVTSKGNPFTAVSMDLVLDTVRMNLHDSIKTAHAELVAQGPLPTVLGDHLQMGQLLQNLVGNAIKFHRPDVSPRVLIRCGLDHGMHVLTVEDNGIGIAPEYRDHIFTMFKRLHSGDTYPGTGIGLAICKRILDRHGGRIWVEESPLGGASFHFTLPAIPAESAD